MNDPNPNPDPNANPNPDPNANPDPGPQPTWRDPFLAAAGDDPKQKAFVERFTDPGGFLKSAWESQQRIRAGDLLKPLAADATEDDIKAYREQHGIPLESKAYLETLPDGLVLGEDDAALFGKFFLDRFHKVNASPSIVHEAIAGYNEFQQFIAEQEKVADEEAANQVSQTLRDEWGADYRKNMNIAEAFLSGQHGLSEEARARFLNARTNEGKAFFNDPEIVRWMVNLGRATMDDHTIVDGGQTDNKSLLERKAEIEGKMGTEAYTKNPAMQSEYQKIVQVLSKRGELDEYGNVKVKAA